MGIIDKEVKRLNQKLSVDNNNKKEKVKKNKVRNNAPLEIGSIAKFFSIAVLIFGICMIGTGSYSMYKGSVEETANTKPEIRLEQTSAVEVALKIKHDKELVTVTYQWNEEESTTVPTNGKKEVETKIEVTH